MSMIWRQQFVYIVYLDTFTYTTDHNYQVLMQPLAVCGACPLWTHETRRLDDVVRRRQRFQGGSLLIARPVMPHVLRSQLREITGSAGRESSPLKRWSDLF